MKYLRYIFWLSMCLALSTTIFAQVNNASIAVWQDGREIGLSKNHTNDFGSVPINRFGSEKVYVISNSGTSDLVIEGVQVGSVEFVATELSNHLLSAGQTVKLMVNYIPKSIGDFTAGITIKNSDPDPRKREATFIVKGTGYDLEFPKKENVLFYAHPTLNFYTDALTFDFRLGARMNVKSVLGLFGLSLLEDENIFAGAGLHISSGGTTTQVTGDITLFNLGFGIEGGYRFQFLYDYLTVSPVLYLGMSFGQLNASSIGLSSKMGFELVPKIEADYQLMKMFKVGLALGYNLYVYDYAIGSLFISLSFAYML